MAKSKSYEMLLKIAGKTDSSLKAACNTAAKNIDALGKTAKNAGKMIAGAAAAGAAAVGTIGVAAVKAASDYEAQLANVATLLTGTEAEVAARTSEIGSQIMEVSNRTGVATADLTDGMYQVVSAFGDSADAASILETAAKSAAAGNATTTDSINLLSAVTKGYGDTSAEAVPKGGGSILCHGSTGTNHFPGAGGGHGESDTAGQHIGRGTGTAFRRHGHPDRRNRIHRGSSDPAKGYYAGLPIAVQEHERGPAKHGL